MIPLMANGMKRATKNASVADEAPNFAAITIFLKIPQHRAIKTLVNIMPAAVEIRCLLTEGRDLSMGYVTSISGKGTMKCPPWSKYD